MTCDTALKPFQPHQLEPEGWRLEPHLPASQNLPDCLSSLSAFSHSDVLALLADSIQLRNSMFVGLLMKPHFPMMAFAHQVF